MTASPGFQFRTAEPVRSTTPDASLPITWNGWSWRAPHTLSLPSRFRKPNVGSGSKIDVHTVLKLIELAMTPTIASSGAISGSGKSSTRVDLRGSFCSDGIPSNIVWSSARTSAPRADSGIGRAPSSSPGAPSRIAVRMASIAVVMSGDRSGAHPARASSESGAEPGAAAWTEGVGAGLPSQVTSG